MLDRAGAMAVFAQVVADGSFSAAAQTLRLTPSAVSKQIARLEARLGVRLFHRTTRSLSLTGEGKAYFETCRRILNEIDEAEAAISANRGQPRGMLRINAATAVGRDTVAPVVSELLLLHPELQVELTLSDHIIDIVREGVDVAIRIAALTDSSLIARKLRPVHRQIIASPQYLARYGAPATPKDLSGHNCLVFEGLTDWRFDTPNGPATVRVSGNFQTNDAAAMRAAAVHHLGIARIASFYIADEVSAGRLIPVLTQFRTAEATAIYAVYSPGRHLSPKVRAFVDLLVARMQPEPSPADDGADGTPPPG